MSRGARIARVVLGLCVAALAGLIVAARRGVQAPAAVAAGVGTAAALAAGAALLLAVWRLRRPPGRRARDASEALGMSGVLILAVAGIANWAFEYRALVVLNEGDRVQLGAGNLDAEAFGPLGLRNRPRGTLALEKVRLIPEGGGFLAESRLEYAPEEGQASGLTVVSGRSSARIGRLFAHQGAFGFVPRIIVQQHRRTLFDRWVPIRSRIEPGREIAFEDTIAIEEAGLTLDVAVSLDRLDESMKGHPVLVVQLQRGDEIVGGGELLPGHGADLRDGWHVGFGGMRRWSELDLVSDPHRGLALLGIVLAAGGALAFAVSAWRRW